MTVRIRSLPRASTAIASTKAESIPPEAEDGPGKGILAQVIPYAQNQGGPGLRFERGQRRDLAEHRLRTHLQQRDGLLEYWRTRREPALRVKRKRCTVEHHFILTTHQMGIEQRHLHGIRSLGHALLALFRLAQMKWGGIQYAQDLGPGCLDAMGRFIEPGVFTDQQAKAQALYFNHDAAQARIAAGRKVAPFIKHLVVRQFAFAVGCNQAAFTKDRSRVESLRHSPGLGPNIPLLSELMRMPHHHEQARQIGQCTSAFVQRGGTSLHEGRPQQQVFRRITTQPQFRAQDETGPLGVGEFGRFNDLSHIASEVADGGIELRQCHLHRGLN